MSRVIWVLFRFSLPQLMMQFAYFPGHYASTETPDLNHKGCHLHRCDLDHGCILFTPSCDLPEIVYLQVQVRGICKSPGLRGTCPIPAFSQLTGTLAEDGGSAVWIHESQGYEYPPRSPLTLLPFCWALIHAQYLHFSGLFLFSSQQFLFPHSFQFVCKDKVTSATRGHVLAQTKMGVKMSTV